jgi:hypothetical protein
MRFLIWFLCLSSLAVSPFLSSAQKALPNGHVRASLLGMGTTEPGFFVLGAGAGASARMGTYFTLNGDLSYGQRDFPVSGGILERRATHLQISTDFYPAKAFQGFYLGAYLSYTQVGKEAKDGLSSAILTSEPDTYIGIGLQIGFSAQLSHRLHLLTRASLGANNEGAGYTGMIGIGYTFWPTISLITD